MDVGNNPLLDIVRREARERRDGMSIAAMYDDPRQVPLFMKRLNWDRFIYNMGIDINIMVPFLSSPNQDSDARFLLNKLREVCRSLMSEFQDSVGMAEVLLRRKVKSTKATDISTAHSLA